MSYNSLASNAFDIFNVVTERLTLIISVSQLKILVAKKVKLMVICCAELQCNFRNVERIKPHENVIYWKYFGII